MKERISRTEHITYDDTGLDKLIDKLVETKEKILSHNSNVKNITFDEWKYYCGLYTFSVNYTCDETDEEYEHRNNTTVMRNIKNACDNIISNVSEFELINKLLLQVGIEDYAYRIQFIKEHIEIYESNIYSQLWGNEEFELDKSSIKENVDLISLQLCNLFDIINEVKYARMTTIHHSLEKVNKEVRKSLEIIFKNSDNIEQLK